MLAYTAVDGLRAISRDFDLAWQPSVGDDLVPSGRNWRTSFQASQRRAQQALAALLALLPVGIMLSQR